MNRLLLVATLALLTAAPCALAQQTGADEVHRLEIREGRVFHDGVEIPDRDLPPGMDVQGLNFTFEYSGPVMPALTLNGRVYALDGDRLTVLDQAVGAEEARAMAVAPTSSPEEGRRQAEEAYLATLSERDRALYARLMREREMEIDALRLAYSFRQTADPAERDRLRQELHQHLEAMFDLKQDNRREEIRQADAMLETMRRQVEEREAQREELIRERLRELTGEP